MAELGLQELQKGEVEECQGLQEMEGVEGFHQEKGSLVNAVHGVTKGQTQLSN